MRFVNDSKSETSVLTGPHSSLKNSGIVFRSSVKRSQRSIKGTWSIFTNTLFDIAL